MQKTIDLLRSRGELTEIHDELDIYLEIPHIAYVEVKKENSKALLFTNPVNKKDGTKFQDPVLMNLFGSFERTELLFGRSVEGVAEEIETLLHMKPPASMRDKFSMLGDLFSLKNIFPKRLKGEGACQEVKFLGDDAFLHSSSPWIYALACMQFHRRRFDCLVSVNDLTIGISKSQFPRLGNSSTSP